MRKRFTVLAAAAALLLLFGSVSFAQVATTPHNITAAQGICSNCHVPHLSGGDRLWPTSEAASVQHGEVGPLCYSCHDGTIATNANVTTTAWDIPADRTGAAGGAHGLNRSGATGGYPNTTVSTTLPYGDGSATGTFECTTCHDPHNDPGTVASALTLLRFDIEDLCDRCHTSRGDADAAWVSGYGPANALGSHPVGTDVTGDSDANSPIDIGYGIAPGGSDLDQPYTGSATAGRHDLGGHLIEGLTNTGITCTTCHSVHGPVDPEEGPAASIPEDLLSISQGVVSASGVGDGFTANGGQNAVAANALCENCHGFNAANTWNPGATANSHPADDVAAGYGAQGDIATIPSPIGTFEPTPFPTTGNAPGPEQNPMCESCHKAHGATANSHILRAAEAGICDVCHSTSFTGHHPVGAALLTNSNMSGTGAGSGADDGNIGNGDGDLYCSDCHGGGAAGGAHNWTAAGFPSLEPDWYPDTDNGRTARGAAPYDAVADQSRSCLLCHTSDNARQAPTRYTADGDANPYGEYQDAGDGTHWLGTTVLDWTNGEFPNGTAFNALSAAWTSTGATGFDGYSMFGGTNAAPEVVCESCHSLNPAWNDGYTIATRATTSLLLASYNEDLVEDQAELCQGCHGHDPAVSTPHPMTNDPVSKAVDQGSAINLITFGQSRGDVPAPWNASYMNANATDNAWIPGVNQLNCNSCHQPHDTIDQSGTWILEMLSTDIAGGGPPGPTGTLYGAAYNLDGTGWGQPYQALCYDCHSY